MKIEHIFEGLNLSPFITNSRTFFKELLFIGYIVIYSSCIQELDIQINESEPNLVVNSIFVPNNSFLFDISYDSEITHPYDNLIDSIKFKLLENEIVILDTICLLGKLQVNYYPKSGLNYSIFIEDKSGKTVTCTDVIPELVGIDEASFRYPAGVDEYGEKYADVTITFTDPILESNYYEVLIYSILDNVNDSYWNLTDCKIVDPVLLNEGDKDYLPSTYFFSDELINGQKYKLRICSPGGTGNSSNYGISMRSISKNYYLYRKYYTRHAYNQQFDGGFLDLVFKGEPQPMFTNIVNGYGIFAGYQETSTILNKIE